jgi:phenylacetate-CoA ligase
MESILNNYTSLKPYFKEQAFGEIHNADKPFFEALRNYDVDYSLDFIKKSDPLEIEKISRENYQQLKSAIKEKITAYKKFLADQSGEFIDKSNYLHKYPLTELLPDSYVDYTKMISVSSGSSGKPYFWPRGDYLEVETTIIYEMILKDFFNVDKKKTLVIDAYSMGMYVAGVFTLNSCLRIAQRGYPLSVITPGISLDSILRIISEIGSLYEQIVICGYPPFVKDTIEEGINRGFDWSSYNLKFIFGAEAISEDWREYLYDKAKVSDYYTSSINTYGSADAAILGHETPLSILIKRICTKNEDLLKKLFNGRTVSTFVQYHPHLKYFESINDELICSAVGGMPLLRYNLHDAGAVYTFNNMVDLLKKEGIDILSEAEKLNIPIWRLPFIVLFGKSDQTITLYGLNIYPQTIRNGLEDSEVINMLTTRMTMATKYDDSKDQYIEVVAELQKDVVLSNDLVRNVEERVYNSLLKHNYEYKTLVEKIGEDRARPKIVLVPYGLISEDRGSKQKWINTSPKS